VKKKKGFIAVFLDIRKAFDSVPFDVVCHALKMQKIPLVVVKFLFHWIHGHSKKLVQKDSVGRELAVGCGTPQGSVLSPFLFNCVMNTLSYRLRGESSLFLPAMASPPPNLVVNLESGRIDVNHLLYADDTTLLASSYDDAQNLLNVCMEWSKAVGMDFSPSKCAFMEMGEKNCFKKLSARRKVLMLNGEKIAKVDEFKFLGMNFRSGGGLQVIQNRDEKRETLKSVCSRVQFSFNPKRGIPLLTGVSILRTFVEGLFYYNVEVHPLDLVQMRKNLGLAGKKALCLHPCWSTTEVLEFLGWMEPVMNSCLRQLGLLIRMLNSREDVYHRLMVMTILDENRGEWMKRLVENLCEVEKKDECRKKEFWENVIGMDVMGRKKWFENLKEKHERKKHTAIYHCREAGWAVFRFWSFSLVPWERRDGVKERRQCELCGMHDAGGMILVQVCEDSKIVEVLEEAAEKLPPGK